MNFSPLQIGTRPSHSAEGPASAAKADALALAASFRSLVDVLANGTPEQDEDAPRSDDVPSADGDHLFTENEDPRQPHDLCSPADTFASAPAVVAAVQSAPIADWAVPPPVVERADEPVGDGNTKDETALAGREIRKPQPLTIRAAESAPEAAEELLQNTWGGTSVPPIAGAEAPANRIEAAAPEVDQATPAPDRAALRAESLPIAEMRQSAKSFPRDTDGDTEPAPARTRLAAMPALARAVVESAHEIPNTALHLAATPHVLAPSGVAVLASTGTGLVPPAVQTLPDTTISEIVRSIRLQASANGGEARIRLEPNHFGELTVAIRVEHNQVVARLQAESPLVREWLQTNQGWLRQQLAEHQLTLDRLEVIEPASDSERPDGHETREERRDVPQRERRRQQHAEPAERFEVVA